MYHISVALPAYDQVKSPGPPQLPTVIERVHEDAENTDATINGVQSTTNIKTDEISINGSMGSDDKSTSNRLVSFDDFCRIVLNGQFAKKALS